MTPQNISKVQTAADAAALFREMHLQRSCQVPRRAKGGAFALANVAIGCALAKGQREERFYVLPLDANGGVLAEPITVSVGHSDGTVGVDAGAVFRAALKAGAEEVVVAHNHPGGDLTPSKADLQTTAKLREAAKLLGVKLLDHLIVSSDGKGGVSFVSLAEITDGWTE